MLILNKQEQRIQLPGKLKRQPAFLPFAPTILSHSDLTYFHRGLLDECLTVSGLGLHPIR